MKGVGNVRSQSKTGHITETVRDGAKVNRKWHTPFQIRWKIIDLGLPWRSVRAIVAEWCGMWPKLPYSSLIWSRMLAFKWHENYWPWMTLSQYCNRNCIGFSASFLATTGFLVFASLRFSFSLDSKLMSAPNTFTKIYSCAQKLLFFLFYCGYIAFIVRRNVVFWSVAICQQMILVKHLIDWLGWFDRWVCQITYSFKHGLQRILRV